MEVGTAYSSETYVNRCQSSQVGWLGNGSKRGRVKGVGFCMGRVDSKLIWLKFIYIF